MKKKDIIALIISICILAAFTHFIYHILIHKDLVEDQSEQIEYGFKRLLNHGEDVQVNIDHFEIYLCFFIPLNEIITPNIIIEPINKTHLYDVI